MTTTNLQSTQLLNWLSGTDSGKVSITQPYAQSGTVFACIDAILNAALSMQMMISTGDDKIVEGGPAYEYTFRNRDMPLSRLITYTIGIYALDRLVYWITPDKAVGEPDKIIVASRLNCKPVIRDGVVMGYYLCMPNGKQIVLSTSEVYVIYGFDPYNRIGIPSAIGPVIAGSASIGADALSSMYVENLYANGARPDGVIEYPGSPNAGDIDRMRDEWISRHGGVRKAGSTAILTGGSKYQSISSTLKELDSVNFKNMTHDEICSVMGVPGEVINLSRESQYANGPAQQRFITNTIIPFLNLFAEHYTTGVLSRFTSIGNISASIDKSKHFVGRKTIVIDNRKSYLSAKHKAIQTNTTALFAWFNHDDHPTVRQMNFERTKEALHITDWGVPYNDAIDAYDLPFTHQSWGDTSFMSAGKIPVSFLIEPPVTEEGEEEGKMDKAKGTSRGVLNTPETEPDSAKALSAARLASMRRTVLFSRIKHEKSYTNALRAFFVRQQRSIEDKLKSQFKEEGKMDKAKGTSRGVLNTPNNIKADARAVLQFVFDIKEENGKLIAINETFFWPAAQTGAETLYAEIAAGVTKLPDYKNSKTIKNAIRNQTAKITSVNETTRAAIQSTLEEAIENGSSYKDVITSLKDKFNMRLNSAKITAATQITAATEAGRNAGMESAGIAKKAWGTAGDSGVRDIHAQAAVDYRSGIPIDQPFIVNGEALMYPGDPAGSAGNIIGCRCYTVPIVN